jgi:hypothetical protein
MSTKDDGRPRLTEAQLLRGLEIAPGVFRQHRRSASGLDDVPYHLPSPDGGQHIPNITRQRDLSYAKYKAALECLSEDFEAARRKDS